MFPKLILKRFENSIESVLKSKRLTETFTKMKPMEFFMRARFFLDSLNPETKKLVMESKMAIDIKIEDGEINFMLMDLEYINFSLMTSVRNLYLLEGCYFINCQFERLSLMKMFSSLLSNKMFEETFKKITTVWVKSKYSNSFELKLSISFKFNTANVFSWEYEEKSGIRSLIPSLEDPKVIPTDNPKIIEKFLTVVKENIPVKDDVKLLKKNWKIPNKK